MKTLGGFAFNMAKNKAFGDSIPSRFPVPQTTSTDRRPGSGVSALFKPTQDIRRQRSASPTEATEATTMMQSVLTALPSLPGSSGPTSGHITIIDLLPLLTSAGRIVEPEVVADIVVPRIQPSSKLSFSNDGTRLAVSSKDGHTTRVYDIRPTSMVVRRVLTGIRSDPNSGYADDLRSMIHAGLHTGQVAPVRVYDLQRGRTNAVIENISWNDDMRWVAIGSRKRTVHVFPVNPYGGRPDDVSHLEGHVRNATEFVSLLKKLICGCTLTPSSSHCIPPKSSPWRDCTSSGIPPQIFHWLQYRLLSSSPPNRPCR